MILQFYDLMMGVLNFMKCFSFIFIICFLSAGLLFAGEILECHPRKGLGNFIEKCEKGEEVKIAYFGGSITAQKGYRVKSLKWFQEQYPKAKLSEVDAAIGGTNSELGVFRMDYDVLPHKPDLVFVEFAVNDGGTKPAPLHRAMEGIVRKIWKQDSKTDIIFVYTLVDKMVNTLNEGKYPQAAASMELLAEHYGIPTIHMGVEVANLVKQGKLVMKGEKGGMTKVSGDSLNETSKSGNNKVMSFSKDGVHPYTDTGHQLYMESIIRSFGPIKAASVKGPHDFSKAFRDDNLENAKMIPFDKVNPGKGWSQLGDDNSIYKRFKKRMPTMWTANKSEAEVSFKFNGSYLAFYDILGPNCGKVNVKVDEKMKVLTKIDRYCTYHRISKSTVLGDKSYSDHQVHIKISEEKFDKRSILFERNRADFDKKPEKYEGTNWYVGGILMVGDLITE